MVLSAGNQLGPYEIVALIGAGGMGEVYEARDHRLNRTVAIKVLPEHLKDDSERRRRLLTEARAVAALAHPHICVLHDFGEYEGNDFLVMEYLQGETLARRLQRGALPLAQALDSAIEIADALDRAHSNGIIHRDLKPGNVMLTRAGSKLLDFGLAKPRPAMTTPAAIGGTMDTASVTAEGTILGTVHYMAPEQITGNEVDHRTDIFAFGCTLHEMLTGSKAFDGTSPVNVIAAILDYEPPAVSTLAPYATPALDRVLRKALAKDPEYRWQSARDLADELRWIRETGPDAEAARNRGVRRRQVLKWIVPALAAMLVLVVLGYGRKRDASRQETVKRETITLPTASRLALSTVPGETGLPTLALSNDGNRLVYVVDNGTTQQLYLRSMQEFAATPIQGTEGGFAPFFSPDGQWVGFFTPGKLKKAFVGGGEPVILCDALRVWGATWAGDDTIWFSADEGSTLFRISAQGGSPQAVAAGRREFLWPAALPGNEALLITTYVVRRPHIELLIPATGERRMLVASGASARYVPTGHLVYAQDGGLQAVSFDLDRLEVTGPSTPVLVGLRTELHGAGQFTTAADGTLAYVEGPAAGNGTLVWVDGRGAIEPLPVQPQQYGHLALSPDGHRLAAEITSTKTDVFILNLERANWSRLTTDGNNVGPTWTSDGKQVIFGSDRAGPLNLFSQIVDGAGSAARLTTSPNDQFPSSASPDGKVLAFIEFTAATKYDIGILDLDGLGEARPLFKTRFNEAHPVFAPDGRWIAYGSDESGQYETYVQRFPSTSERWKISDGGTKPIWSPNGEELFYDSGPRRMVVPITRQPSFIVGRPRVFTEGPFVPVAGRSFDVGRDGRLLLIRATDQPRSDEIRVVSNWFEELKSKVPGR